LVLVILAVIWAAVLLPPYLQNRSESRPADSISTFRNQLSVLERRSTMVAPTGRSLGVPAPRPTGRPRPVQFDRARLARAEAKKRRRDILVTLLAAAGLTFVLSFVLPAVIVLHLLIDVLLAGYVALLVRQKRVAEERAMKVRYLSSAPTVRRPAPVAAHYGTAPQPQLALRRSVGG
jgi:hypothetical protein